jgi:putative membrane protein
MNVVVSHWSANVVALVAYVVAAAAHLIGVGGPAARRGRAGARLASLELRRAVTFQAGLLVLLLSLVSPMGFWAYRFVWVRNLQDVILAIAVPMLIVLGAPWLPLARGLGLGGRLRSGQPDAPDATAARTFAGSRSYPDGWQTLPILVTVAFCALWWAWHVPALFDAAVRNPFVYGAEVVTYVGLGTAFWLQLAASPPLRPQLAPLHRVALLVATAASGTVLGLMRVYSSGLAYPAYLGFHHHDLSTVADQQVGGAVLWVIPLVPFSIMAVALVIGWLSDDEAEAAAGFDRLLKTPKSAWPSRPGLR